MLNEWFDTTILLRLSDYPPRFRRHSSRTHPKTTTRIVSVVEADHIQTPCTVDVCFAMARCVVTAPPQMAAVIRLVVYLPRHPSDRWSSHREA